MTFRILVASYTSSIYTLVFDPLKPPETALVLSSSLEVGHHPSWLERHPRYPSVVFTGLEQADGRLLAIKYDLETGKGRVVANEASGGSDPCSILCIENDILVGNYSSGTIGIFEQPSIVSLSTGSNITLKSLQPALQFSGSGPCSERQEASHPHQVYYSQNTDEVLVPDLGADTIWRLKKSATGIWERNGELKFEKHTGGGPRHVIVYDNKLYTLLELTSHLTAHSFSQHSTPELLSEVTLPMPKGLDPLIMLAAELLCPLPNDLFPTPLLYVSNRNDPRPSGDIISIYTTIASETGSLKLVGELETGLSHLRGFIFFGPQDRYLIAGGANGGGVKVFERLGSVAGSIPGIKMQEVAYLPASACNDGSGLAPTGFLCL